VATVPRPEPLPVLPAAQIIPEPATAGWLVEGLWTHHGVGLIGGAPKCCKTWLALDLAVSVASGTPALGRFSVRDRGPVLFYGAEDDPAQLRARIGAIASSRHFDLEDLDLGLVLPHSLRLDTEHDRQRLAATLDRHRPRLLVLDPLVRLHRLDENSAGEISALLAELRFLQRGYNLALILVHHLRKQGGPVAGQALRGSSDLHAWGDSNLFLRRRDRQLVLTAEHRTAPPPPPCELELTAGPSPYLRVLDSDQAPQEPTADLAERVLAALADAQRPLGRDQLRQILRTRNITLGDTLARLRAESRIERRNGGFVLRDAFVPVPDPISQREPERQ
jgi:hypothetical protein